MANVSTELGRKAVEGFNRVGLMTGTLTGTGRESGAETQAELAWLMKARDGRIAEIRTFPGEQQALEAARG